MGYLTPVQIESSYKSHVEKKMDECSFASKFVKEVKKHHALVKNLLMRMKNKLIKKSWKMEVVSDEPSTNEQAPTMTSMLSSFDISTPTSSHQQPFSPPLPSTPPSPPPQDIGRELKNAFFVGIYNTNMAERNSRSGLNDAVAEVRLNLYEASGMAEKVEERIYQELLILSHNQQTPVNVDEQQAWYITKGKELLEQMKNFDFFVQSAQEYHGLYGM
jgi:hypothetical protein